MRREAKVNRTDYLSRTVSAREIASNNYFKFIILSMLKCLIHHFPLPPCIPPHAPVGTCTLMSYKFDSCSHMRQWWCLTRHTKQSLTKNDGEKIKMIAEIMCKDFSFLFYFILANEESEHTCNIIVDVKRLHESSTILMSVKRNKSVLHGCWNTPLKLMSIYKENNF